MTVLVLTRTVPQIASNVLATAPQFEKKPEDVEVSEFDDITLKATVAGL